VRLDNRHRYDNTQPLISAARDLACRLLEDNPERTRHSAGVAARATRLSTAVPQKATDLLVAAAWLHDIGYSTVVRDTAFHPLDGARYLRSLGWDPLICDLVAHHSGSRYVAELQGLGDELADFTFVAEPVSDALTIADQTIGPNGRPFSLEERLRDMLERHGPGSVNARAHPQRQAYFRSALQRVNTRLGGGTDVGDPAAVVPARATPIPSQQPRLKQHRA